MARMRPLAVGLRCRVGFIQLMTHFLFPLTISAGKGPRRSRLRPSRSRPGAVYVLCMAFSRWRGSNPHNASRWGLNAVVQEALELLAYALRVGHSEVALQFAPKLPTLGADLYWAQYFGSNYRPSPSLARRCGKWCSRPCRRCERPALRTMGTCFAICLPPIFSSSLSAPSLIVRDGAAPPFEGTYPLAALLPCCSRFLVQYGLAQP